MPISRSGRLVPRTGLVLALVAVLAAGACSGGAEDGKSKSEASPSVSPTPVIPPPTLAVSSPANKAKNVPTGTFVTFATNAKLADVRMTGPGGTVVPGTVAADGHSWIPGRQLAFGASYSVRATATNGNRSAVATTSFSTMGKPDSITGADLYVSDKDVVGIGMPVVVEFTRSIPQASRAAVERRLLVTSTPKVEGSWHWFSSSEVHYRPKAYWAVGTKVSVRLAVGGAPMGNGHYGKRDRTASFTIGRAVTSRIVNAQKTMYVYKDGVLLRKFPISLGRASMPTSSGVMVAMERYYQKTFDSGTFGLPVDSPGGYRQNVFYDVRFTWGGEFVHAAPWSVGDQGRRNVSHGCVNASTENARWFYELTLKGDPIEVVGTGTKVKRGDGWTDWTMSWPEYLAGSALH